MEDKNLPEGFVEGLHEFIDEDNPDKGFRFIQKENPRKYRIITTGSMQRRFTIEEEILVMNDPVAKVIRDRLLGSTYCDLDFKDSVEGLSYILNYLATSLEWDETIKEGKTTYIFSDGNEQEVYKGIL